MVERRDSMMSWVARSPSWRPSLDIFFGLRYPVGRKFVEADRDAPPLCATRICRAGDVTSASSHLTAANLSHHDSVSLVESELVTAVRKQAA